MIIPDVNLLLNAYNRDFPDHSSAKTWWKRLRMIGNPSDWRGSPSLGLSGS